MKQTLRVLEYSRIFSLPMSSLSWLIIFVYSLADSGNILYGLVAFLGISFVHLGTNLIDDYFDYKYLITKVNFDKEEYLKNSQKTKCRYLISGFLSTTQLLGISAAYFLIGLICGIYLYINCGTGVLYFALAGGGLSIIYPLISRICLSEVAIALIYGPILFGGVYYVMTGTYSNDVYLISIPSMIMTVILLYIHTIMDYEFDLNEGKCTIANRFDSQLDSIIVLKFLLIAAYLSVVFICILDIVDWQVLLTFLTIPLAIDLYQSLIQFSSNPEELPDKKWYHFPMEKLSILKARGEASFMIRMYQSRNLMIYFSLFLITGIILSLLF